MRHIHLDQIGSTNSYLKELINSEGSERMDELTYVTTYRQTSGRGQRGNHWESEPGKNMSLSVFLKPSFGSDCTPFDLNIVTSLALHDVLRELDDGSHIMNVKWPNDILIGHKKIAGILTENEWEGAEWKYAIIGIGLNVLQTKFGDYTPPATSLRLENMVDFCDSYEIWHHSLAEKIIKQIEIRYDTLAYDPYSLRREYIRSLYRFREESVFMTPDGKKIKGQIVGVEPNGLLLIETEHGILKFAFKEVRFV